jgi:hypothetical protein
VNDLERRRRAIADALRAAMTEPAVPTPAKAEPAATAATPARPSLREALAAQIDVDEIDPVDPEGDDRAAPPVPPLDLDASLSRQASLALFGHA